MSNRYSIAEARDRLTQLVRDAENGMSVELTRRGKPVAILVSLSEYEKLHKRGMSFWEALEEFKREVDLKSIGIEPSTFEGLRDQTKGREVGW
jgi:prevent-host-death family protein